MSAIVLDHRKNLVSIDKKPNEDKIIKLDKKGSLQGRKVLPLAFYILIGGSIVGGIGAVALAVSAIALSLFALHVAAAACVLLCLTNAIGAFFIHRLSPEKDLYVLNNKLLTKIQDYVVENKSKKVEETEINFNIENKVDKEAEDKERKEEQLFINLKNEQKKQLELLEKINIDFNEYARKQETDKKQLQDKLDFVIDTFEELGKDSTQLKEIKEAINGLKFNFESDGDGKTAEKLIKNHHDVCNQFYEVLKVLENLVSIDIMELKQNNEDLRNKLEKCEIAKNSFEAQLKQKELDLISLNKYLNNDLSSSDIR